MTGLLLATSAGVSGAGQVPAAAAPDAPASGVSAPLAVAPVTPEPVAAPDVAENDSAGAAVAEPVGAGQGTAHELAGARVSVQVRDISLLQLTKLVAETTPAQFRFGGVPDVVLSADLHEEELVPSLKKLLKSVGWSVRPQGADLFLLPGTEWTCLESGEPPRGWLAPPEAHVRISEGARTDGAAPQFVPSASRHGARWLPLLPALTTATRPGLQIGPPASVRPFFVRAPLDLQFLPTNARLLLETNAAATLYVNGAPLLRNWTGLRVVDVSSALHRGDNCLAVAWSAPGAAPFLRYEWVFDSEPGGVPGVNSDRSR